MSQLSRHGNLAHPKQVEVRTGEEDEEVLYSHRAKLYRWMDGEWKERGLGDIKLLRDSSAGRTRLLMRREPVSSRTPLVILSRGFTNGGMVGADLSSFFHFVLRGRCSRCA